MNRRLWRLVAGIGIILPALIVTASGAGAVAPDHPKWMPDGEQYTPRTDGDYVVWLDDRRGAGMPFDIYGAPAGDGEEFVISNTDNGKNSPDVSNGVVVWRENGGGCEGCLGDILGLRIATGERFVISATPFEETRVTIDGDWVAWVEEDQPTGDRLYVTNLNLATGGGTMLISQANQGSRIDLPSLDGDRLLWSEYLRGNGESEYQLKTLRLTGGEPVTVDEGVVSGLWGLTDDFDLAGDLITWAVDHHLYVSNLATGVDKQMLADTGSCPTTDGRFIFWEDFRNYDEDRRREIELWGHDLLTGSAFPIARADNENHEYPHVANGVLVWQAITEAQERDVFADLVENVLPTYGVDQQTDADLASYIWFPETGHSLQTEFKAFWDQSGGLPVFGFPMTEEFEELNPDTGEIYRVQYLERQRYEHHPDNAGTPYEVLMGRLGAAAAEARGYLDTAPFQPVAANGDGCHYFTETSHTLCGRFQDYWQASGLEFGDEGVSFRESVALFGYPISEEFVDPETGIVSQYFERAIFEYHPENDGTEFEVLLRRLSIEELENRSWCGPQALGCQS